MAHRSSSDPRYFGMWLTRPAVRRFTMNTPAQDCQSSLCNKLLPAWAPCTKSKHAPLKHASRQVQEPARCARQVGLIRAASKARVRSRLPTDTVLPIPLCGRLQRVRARAPSLSHDRYPSRVPRVLNPPMTAFDLLQIVWPITDHAGDRHALHAHPNDPLQPLTGGACFSPLTRCHVLQKVVAPATTYVWASPN